MVAGLTGKKPQVAPYSGAMLAMVAWSSRVRLARPGPWNSTNLPTTPFLRSIWVTVSTRSVAVEPSGNLPSRRKPTTSGISIGIGGGRLPPGRQVAGGFDGHRQIGRAHV